MALTGTSATARRRMTLYDSRALSEGTALCEGRALPDGMASSPLSLRHVSTPEVPTPISITVVVNHDSAPRPTPMSAVEVPAVVSRTNPICARIRRQRPISAHERIASAHPIPIRIDPNVPRPRRRGSSRISGRSHRRSRSRIFRRRLIAVITIRVLILRIVVVTVWTLIIGIGVLRLLRSAALSVLRSLRQQCPTGE
jgi:hypothetical protein